MFISFLIINTIIYSNVHGKHNQYLKNVIIPGVL